MKHYWMAAMLLATSTWAMAQTPAEVELLSVQRAYQNALTTIQSTKVALVDQESQLVVAKQRLAAAQSQVTQLEAEVTRLQAAQTAAEQNLSSLGSRLDAAWGSVKPGI